MSASDIYNHAPIGSTIAWSDGTTRPPERFKNKLLEWERCNNQGRLIRKEPARTLGNRTLQAGFTIHEDDYGDSGGVVALRVFRVFSVDSKLTFRVVQLPPSGSVRVFNQSGNGSELVHLAPNRTEAETWLRTHHYPDAVLDEVPVDEATATDDTDGDLS